MLEAVVVAGGTMHLLWPIVSFPAVRGREGQIETSIWEQNIGLHDPYRGWSSQPGMCPGRESHQQPFRARDVAQPLTEPRRPGRTFFS